MGIRTSGGGEEKTKIKQTYEKEAKEPIGAFEEGEEAEGETESETDADAEK